MVYLFGAGGHARTVKEILELQGDYVNAFIVDDSDIETCQGLPVYHSPEGLSPIIVAVGANRNRKRIVESLDCEFSSAIHPSAIISPSAQIGEGTVIMPGSIINAGARIGRHCIINTGASVGHDCVIEDFCHVAPHATICGAVHLGEGVWVGAAAVVNQCIEIGRWAIIGSAAAVIHNVEEEVTVVGVPARRI